MPIAETLTRDIDRKMRKISNNPNYYLKKSRQIKKGLREIGDFHTYWLEHPELRRQLLESGAAHVSGNLRKRSKAAIRNIKNAWSYLSNLSNVDFINNLDPSVILAVGNLVDPENIGVRTQRVSLGLEYTPPNSVKVPELIKKFCDNLQQSDFHSVEAAAYAHLYIAAIQPRLDGNKRTARLIQDKLLDSNGLPPAIIPSGERDVYIDLLSNALIGYRDSNFKVQRPFFDYIGGKVNVALDEILGDLKPSK